MNDNYRGGMQTGGARKTWVFDPSSSEDVAQIRDALTVRSAEEEFFHEEHDASTLSIVIDKILDDLPTDIAHAVRLVHLKGFSLRAAGKITGVDHKTVKARAVKGVEMMRKRLVDSVWVAEMLKGHIPANEVNDTRVQGNDVQKILQSLKDDDEQK